MEQLALYKQFLFDNAATVGGVALVLAGFMIVFSLATREVLTWLTKSDLIIKEIKNLKTEVLTLKEEVQSLKTKQNLQQNIKEADTLTQPTSQSPKVTFDLTSMN